MNWLSQVAFDQADNRTMLPDIRAIIADNEPLVRHHLRGMLESEIGLQVLAECATEKEMIEAVQVYKPDLLVLDARLLGNDGLPVLHPVPPAERPIVIFISAHDGYATRAFEAHALDYLLKPVDPQRLHAAIERTRAEIAKLQDRQLTRKLLDYLTERKSDSPSRDRRVVVKSQGRVVFLKMDEIDWIEAAANYVRLQAGSQSYLMREGISHIASRLDSNQFLRIHRSIIVNVRKIKELQPCNRGEYMVTLTNGKELSCSRSYRARLQEFIANM